MRVSSQAIWIVGILTLADIGSAPAAELGRHGFYDQVRVPESQLALVQAVAREFGVEGVQSSALFDDVSAAFKAIKSESASPLECGEKMAQFAKKLAPVIAKFEAAKARRAAEYLVADAVVTAEEFRPEDFKPAEGSRQTASVTSDTGELAESAKFVHLKELRSFTDKNPPSGSEVLSSSDVRDGASHNFFPFQFHGHDMEQIHFALQHPRAVAVYLKAARGQNHLRYAVLSALYEGMTHSPFAHEKRLTRYFAEKRLLATDEAMIAVSKMPEAELNKLVEDAGVRSSIDAEVSAHAAWTPKSDARWGNTRSVASLDQETDHFIDQVDHFEEVR